MHTTVEYVSISGMSSIYDRLAHRDRVFVDEYVKDMKVGNAAESAGMSTATAYKRLQMPDVCQAIALALDERSRLARIDASWVLKRASLLADFSIKNFIVVEGATGRLYYDFTLATDDDWYCINEVAVGAVRAESNAGGRLYADQVKLRTEPKLKALELVRSLIGERVDVTQQITEVRRTVVRPGEGKA